MVQTCCVCFPIDFGVKIIASLTALTAAYFIAQCAYDSNYLQTFGVEAVLETIVAIAFLIYYCFPTYRNQQRIIHFWFFFLLIGGAIWYFF